MTSLSHLRPQNSLICSNSQSSILFLNISRSSVVNHCQISRINASDPSIDLPWRAFICQWNETLFNNCPGARRHVSRIALLLNFETNKKFHVFRNFENVAETMTAMVYNVQKYSMRITSTGIKNKFTHPRSLKLHLYSNPWVDIEILWRYLLYL